MKATAVATDFTRRNAGIDLLRALTMFVMIFVNDFWKIHGVPRWLEHAAGGEDFMGLADVVFPCFLFAVGMSIPYALARRYARGLSGESTVGHILGRTLALLVMGAFVTNSEARLSPDAPYPTGVYWILMVVGFVMVWNQYPRTESRVGRWTFGVLKVVGVLILGYLATTFRSPDGGVFAARWGILGTIGWSYVVCAMVYLFTRDRVRLLIPVLASFVAVCILTTRMREAWGGAAILDFPRPNFLNDFLGGVLHVGNGAAVSLVMAGAVFSLLAARCGGMTFGRKALLVGVTVAALFALGRVAREFWILSKISATPTWVFYVCAIAVAAYSLLSWMAGRGAAGWMRVIEPAGTATLTCYMVPYLAYAVSDMTGVVLPDWLTHGVMGIVNCLCFALVVTGATWCLGKLRIKLKI